MKKQNHLLLGAALLLAPLTSTLAQPTWETVDDFYPGAGAMPRGVGVDALGRVFVTGSPAVGWTVRGSTDGGATWATTDTFRLTPTGNANAVGLAGAVPGADGLNHAVVRELAIP